jgi:hypothetical protein
MKSNKKVKLTFGENDSVEIRIDLAIRFLTLCQITDKSPEDMILHLVSDYIEEGETDETA